MMGEYCGTTLQTGFCPTLGFWVEVFVPLGIVAVALLAVAVVLTISYAKR